MSDQVLQAMLTLLWSGFATLAFATLLGAPKKSVPAILVIVTVGYSAYLAIDGAGFMLPAYFAGAFIMAFMSECAARMIRMPGIIFLTVSLIPLVPGLGLYETMLEAVRGNADAALVKGVNTMLSIAAMAMGVAISSLLAKMVFGRKKNGT